MIILTRNAIHGGVETILKHHQSEFRCPILVCGGFDDPLDTCPFEYEYISSYEDLLNALSEFEVVMYHWIPDWALMAVMDSGLPCIEYVHRVDTAQVDKINPDIVLAHTKHLCDKFNAIQVPYPVDVKHFADVDGSREKIGAVTSYTRIKGIDISIKAASLLKIPLTFYGAGPKEQFEKLAEELNVEVTFADAVRDPASVFGDFRLVLSPARLEGGSPLAVMEALASGCPVVGSNIPGQLECNKLAKEMGFPEPISIFESEDYADMADKIGQALIERCDPRPFMKEFTSMERHLDTIREIVGEI